MSKNKIQDETYQIYDELDNNGPIFSIVLGTLLFSGFLAIVASFMFQFTFIEAVKFLGITLVVNLIIRSILEVISAKRN